MITTVYYSHWEGNRWVTKPYQKEVFKSPNMDHEYIKQLVLVERHPNTTKKLVLMELYGRIKNFGVFDSLVQYGVIVQTGTGKYKAPLYSITPKGEDLLKEARETAFIFDLINLVRGTKSKTLEELDINATLGGVHHMLEADFVKKVGSALNTYTWVKGKLKKNIPFLEDYFAIAHNSKKEAL